MRRTTDLKILIVRLSAFGDIIHALPALHDLLARPEVREVHWLLDSRYAFVARVFPAEVRVHYINLKGDHPIREIWRLRRELRLAAPDLVLDMQGLIKSGLLARLAGAPVIGIDPLHMREKLNRCFVRPTRFFPGERHVVQQYRRVAAAPFQDRPGPLDYVAPQVVVDDAMLRAGAPLLADWGLSPGGYVWLHLGGGWATKQLPAATWTQLTKALIADGITPLLGWGTAVEKAVAEGVKDSVAAALLPSQRLEMNELCALLSQAMAVVGADTGIIHLAAALGTPTVSFWGPSAAWRSAPLGPKDRHIQSNPPCGPCFKRECSQFVCMDMIQADDIMSAIHGIPPLA